MLCDYSGKFFWNLKKSKQYGIVLFEHSTKNGDYYDKMRIKDILKNHPNSKVIIIQWEEFQRHNKRKCVDKPSEILMIGCGICEKIDFNLYSSLENIIAENNLMNELSNMSKNTYSKKISSNETSGTHNDTPHIAKQETLEYDKFSECNHDTNFKIIKNSIINKSNELNRQNQVNYFIQKYEVSHFVSREGKIKYPKNFDFNLYNFLTINDTTKDTSPSLRVDKTSINGLKYIESTRNETDINSYESPRKQSMLSTKFSPNLESSSIQSQEYSERSNITLNDLIIRSPSRNRDFSFLLSPIKKHRIPVKSKLRNPTFPLMEMSKYKKLNICGSNKPINASLENNLSKPYPQFGVCKTIREIIYPKGKSKNKKK